MDKIEELRLSMFGKRVRALRQMIGISIEELSFRCGLHRNYISDVERGTRNVSLKAIEKLALGLKVPVYYLFRLSRHAERVLVVAISCR